VGQPVLAAQQIAAAAIDALGPHDLAAVVTTSGLTPQTLTSDRARLLRAVNRADSSQGLSAEQQAIPSVAASDPGPIKDGRCLRGLCVLETPTTLAVAAREAPLRTKMVLFIGGRVIVQT
jgi:hypothetical protein